jgi:outer membrane protein OmpA-like peptidoglycan-associated protein
MHRLIFTFCFLFVLNVIFAQNKTPFVVEVAAFAESVPNGYFKDISGIYETLDVNYIYRYYIDVPNQEAAESKREEVRAAGFINARIIDFVQLKKSCDALCAYNPPKKTGKKVKPFVPSTSTSTDEDLASAPNKNQKRRKSSSPSKYEKDINHNIQFIYPSSSSSDSPENFHCIFFDYDESFIREDAKIELDRLVSLMQKNPTHQVEILAHTDARGSQEYNNALSMRRAVSTQDYLTRNGIRRTKIIKKPFGESTPIALNVLATGEDTIVGRQLNRRVEFRILDKSGKILNVVDKIRVPVQVQK